MGMLLIFDVENRWNNQTDGIFHQTVCHILLLYCHECYKEWIRCTALFRNGKHVFYLLAAVTHIMFCSDGASESCFYVISVSVSACVYVSVCLCIVCVKIPQYDFM